MTAHVEQIDCISKLCKEFLQEFIKLEGEGFALPRSIVLCGCSEDIMSLMMDEFRREMEKLPPKELRIRADPDEHLYQNGEYYINVGYFLQRIYPAVA